MREVQTGLIKPEYLSRMGELEASQNLNSRHANQMYSDASKMAPSDRRTDFLQSARLHLNASIDSAKKRHQMTTVNRPKSKFSSKHSPDNPKDN